MHFSVEGDVDLAKLESWLSSLLWEPQGPMEILRMKGAVCVAGSDALHVFQAVRELFEVSKGRPNTRSRQPTNRILTVGYKIDERKLKEGFLTCLNRANEGDAES